MLRLLHILFHGCDHHWIGVTNGRFDTDSGSYGNIAYCQCSKCGRPTSFTNAIVKIGEKT